MSFWFKNAVVDESDEERYWGRFAASYDEDGKHVVGQVLLDDVIQILSEEKHLGKTLEFGCGTGFFTIEIAKNAEHLIATDLSDEMVAVAKDRLKGLPNVSVKKASCYDDSFEAGSFDTIFMINLLHVIKNPERAIENGSRLLRKGGKLIAIDFTTYGVKLMDKLKMGWRYLSKWSLPPLGASNHLTPKSLSQMVRNHGLEISSVQILGNVAKALYLKAFKI